MISPLRCDGSASSCVHKSARWSGEALAVTGGVLRVRTGPANHVSKPSDAIAGNFATTLRPSGYPRRGAGGWGYLLGGWAWSAFRPAVPTHCQELSRKALDPTLQIRHHRRGLWVGFDECEDIEKVLAPLARGTGGFLGCRKFQYQNVWWG